MDKKRWADNEAHGAVCMCGVWKVGCAMDFDYVHIAARRNDVEELRRLLDATPELIWERVEVDDDDFAPGNFEGWLPLQLACHSGAAEAAQLLLDRGADPEAHDDEGDSPFMLACRMGRPEVVALLLRHGVNVSVVDYNGDSGLLCASSETEEAEDSNHAEVVRLLVEDGRMDVDARDSNGRTALRWACCNGHPDLVLLLMMKGHADHTIADNKGTTPIAMASGICGLLLKVGHMTRLPL